MRWTRTSALVLTAGLAMAATACGSSSPKASPPASTTTTTIPPIAMPTAAGTFGTRPPAVTVPTGAPPTVLESSDLIAGTGAAAKTGDSVTVQYVLVDYSTGKVIQSSWDGSPFSFTVGQSGIISGWNQGVVGMKVGGRRELILPPAVAYGASPPPDSGIETNATLIFVIDLLKIG
jgi:peptidylprolyl isomerase